MARVAEEAGEADPTDAAGQPVPGSHPGRRWTLCGGPPRLDSQLIFASPDGGLIDLHNWRAREWKPAVEAAGISHGTIYTLRHTFATNAIAAGIGLYELARYMGTSIEMLDRVYGHLVPGAEAGGRKKLDAAAAIRSGV